MGNARGRTVRRRGKAYKRECLRCDKKFVGQGLSNRLCQACQEALQSQPTPEHTYAPKIRQGGATIEHTSREPLLATLPYQHAVRGIAEFTAEEIALLTTKLHKWMHQPVQPPKFWDVRRTSKQRHLAAARRHAARKGDVW